MTDLGFDSMGDELQKATEEEIREVYAMLDLKYEPSQEEDSWKAVLFFWKFFLD